MRPSVHRASGGSGRRVGGSIIENSDASRGRETGLQEPSGDGNPAAKYPALRGQHADYAAKQLRDYASGTRSTDGKTRIMRDIAARLSEEDIAALSSYMQGLR